MAEVAMFDVTFLCVYIDDFLMFSKMVGELNQILRKFWERAKQLGFKFNKENFKFLLREIKIIGDTFNEKGVQPDDDKI